MTEGPQPHLDMDEVRRRAHQISQARREARREYQEQCQVAADADRQYRKNQAIAFAKARSDEKTVAEAELIADAETADDRHRRDIASSLAKAALLRIEELEADRAMLRQLGDWSQKMEGVAA